MLNVPEIQNPELTIDTPEFPEIKNPELNIPDIQNHELILDTPELPEINLNVPDLVLPEIPDLQSPDFTIPELQAPEFELPEIPSLELKLNADTLPDRLMIFIDEKALAMLRDVKLNIMQNAAQPSPTSETINNHYSYSTTNNTNQQNISQNQPSGDIIIPVSIGGQQIETLVISAIQIENARSGGRTV